MSRSPLSDSELRPWTIDANLEQKIVEVGNELEHTLFVTSTSRQAGARGFSAIDKSPFDYTIMQHGSVLLASDIIDPDSSSDVVVQPADDTRLDSIEEVETPALDEVVPSDSGSNNEASDSENEQLAAIDAQLHQALDDLNNPRAFPSSRFTYRKCAASPRNDTLGPHKKNHQMIKSVKYRPRTGPNVLNISCASNGVLAKTNVKYANDGRPGTSNKKSSDPAISMFSELEETGYDSPSYGFPLNSDSGDPEDSKLMEVASSAMEARPTTAGDILGLDMSAVRKFSSALPRPQSLSMPCTPTGGNRGNLSPTGAGGGLLVPNNKIPPLRPSTSSSGQQRSSDVAATGNNPPMGKAAVTSSAGSTALFTIEPSPRSSFQRSAIPSIAASGGQTAGEPGSTTSEGRFAASRSTPALSKLTISSSEGTSGVVQALRRPKLKEMKPLRDQMMTTTGSFTLNVNPVYNCDPAEKVRRRLDQVNSQKIVTDTIKKNKHDQTWSLLGTPGFTDVVGAKKFYASETVACHAYDEDFERVRSRADHSHALLKNEVAEWSEVAVKCQIKPFVSGGTLKM